MQLRYSPNWQKMIEQYVAASRRTKGTNAALVAAYEKSYLNITSQTTPLGDHPTLFVTYSADRKCELITLGSQNYLVYDQYLGQSFNRLNRIQFATHSAAALSQAYACKFIAERLLCLGLPAPAAFFALASRGLEEDAHAKGNPFAVPTEIESVRVCLTGAQELFVMAHELAHHRWSLDPENFCTEALRNVKGFIESRPQVAESESDPGTAGYYEQIVKRAPLDFVQEVFADDFGSYIALRVTNLLNIPPWQTAAGAVLAFKYLRLFRHLELVAHRIADLVHVSDPALFKSEFDKLRNEIWDGPVGRIHLFQFREHFLRHQLGQVRQKLPDFSSDHENRIIELVADYDEKTEYPIVFDLVEKLSETLSPGIIEDMKNNMRHLDTTEMIAMVDKATGWAQ